MRICHLISSIDKGGAETHLYSLIKEQKRLNHEVIVVYLKGNNYWRSFFQKIDVKTYKVDFEYSKNPYFFF